MVDFAESNKMIKTVEKVDKLTTYHGFRDIISFFSCGRTTLNKERNITTKPVISV